VTFTLTVNSPLSAYLWLALPREPGAAALKVVAEGAQVERRGRSFGRRLIDCCRHRGRDVVDDDGRRVLAVAVVLVDDPALDRVVAVVGERAIVGRIRSRARVVRTGE
jgi:hypothetical protein